MGAALTQTWPWEKYGLQLLAPIAIKKKRLGDDRMTFTDYHLNVTFLADTWDS